MQQREYFLGGNTAKGFFSYYEFLMRPEDAEKIYCIKGGPGTGKSSLMKAVAAAARERGLDTDLIHCSSDPDSLDGLILPQLRTAFVDGTSPHTVDPQAPGAVDTIVDLGACRRDAEIVPLKDKILRYNRQISALFASAYRHLAAAAELYRDIAVAAVPFVSAEPILRHLRETYLRPLPPADGQKGKLRKLFLTAVTPQGVICHAPSFPAAHVCVLEGAGFVSGEILRALCADYTEKGYDAEVFYSPLSPDTQIDHLYIPALSHLFLTHDFLNRFPIPRGAAVTELKTPDPNAETAELLSRLREESVRIIRQAKSMHDDLEQCYVPHMDFEKVTRIQTEILQSLFPNS